MTLKEYLKSHDLSATAFADLADMSMNTIYNYLNGQRPTKLHARRIEEVTKGEVTAESMRQQHLS